MKTITYVLLALIVFGLCMMFYYFGYHDCQSYKTWVGKNCYCNLPNGTTINWGR